MNRPHLKLHLILATLLVLVAGIGLSETIALAQSDTNDPLLIVPPELPRYRKTRPVFQIKADETEKKVSVPVYPPAPVQETAEFTPKAWVTTPAQLAKKRAKYQITVRQEAALERRDQMWQGIGKVVGFVLVAGVGVFCLTDVARQIRKAKKASVLINDDGDMD